MKRLFQCPNCDAKLRVPESRLGKSLTCPRCQQRVNSPPPTPLPLESESDVEQQPKPQPEVFQLDNSATEEPTPGDVLPAADESWDAEDPWAGEDINWEEELSPIPPVRRQPPVSPYSRPLLGQGRDRFWLLRGTVSFGYIIAIIIMALSLVGGAIYFYQVYDQGILEGLLGVILCPVLGALIVLPYLFYIQILDCFLAIEENTRRAAAR